MVERGEVQTLGKCTRFVVGPSPLPGYQKTELTVGDATLGIPTEEIAALYG
jgi:hypothetical protein